MVGITVYSHQHWKILEVWGLTALQMAFITVFRLVSSKTARKRKHKRTSLVWFLCLLDRTKTDAQNEMTKILSYLHKKLLSSKATSTSKHIVFLGIYPGFLNHSAVYFCKCFYSKHTVSIFSAPLLKCFPIIKGHQTLNILTDLRSSSKHRKYTAIFTRFPSFFGFTNYTWNHLALPELYLHLQKGRISKHLVVCSWQPNENLHQRSG